MKLDSQKKPVIFTDLDGTLLDHHTYSLDAARSVLTRLHQSGIPVIPDTSKTFAELSRFVSRYSGFGSGFVFENGGGFALPRAWKSAAPFSPSGDDNLTFLLLGPDHNTLLPVARTLVSELDIDCRFASDMGVKGFAEYTGLKEEEAASALQRAASEPLLWNDSEEKLIRFAGALEQHGLTAVRGGRFVSVQGPHTKASAASRYLDFYSDEHAVSREDCVTVALGDSENDRAMLEWADYAVVIPRPDGSSLDLNRPHHQWETAPAAGPEGWSAALSKLFNLA